MIPIPLAIFLRDKVTAVFLFEQVFFFKKKTKKQNNKCRLRNRISQGQPGSSK